MIAGSGRQCSMWLDLSSPLGAFSRILLESSLWTGSQEYCYVWERLDTRFGCSAFQLTPLGQSTDESESSLWPTATTVDARCSLEWWLERQAYWKQRGQDLQLPLAVAAKLRTRLWPTPTAVDHKGNNGNRNRPVCDDDLPSRVQRLWPTPTERDWKSTSHGNQDNSRPLSEVAGLEGKGSLNPDFVEALMMFPIGHTRLVPSESRIDHTG